jgi:GTPase
MTDEDRDTQEGRVNRELREAQAELNALLQKAQHVAKDIGDLAGEITNRVARARGAEPSVVGANAHGQDAGIETGRLKRYEKCVNLDAIDALDREIGQAVANLLKAHRQKAQLGL